MNEDWRQESEELLPIERLKGNLLSVTRRKACIQSGMPTIRTQTLYLSNSDAKREKSSRQTNDMILTWIVRNFHRLAIAREAKILCFPTYRPHIAQKSLPYSVSVNELL